MGNSINRIRFVFLNRTLGLHLKYRKSGKVLLHNIQEQKLQQAVRVRKSSGLSGHSSSR